MVHDHDRVPCLSITRLSHHYSIYGCHIIMQAGPMLGEISPNHAGTIYAISERGLGLIIPTKPEYYCIEYQQLSYYQYGNKEILH